MVEKDLIYRPPQPEPTIRRVYVLPRSLVEKIHEYGFSNGHQSEVSAVKALLEQALVSELEGRSHG
jgi:hypothetical protein